MSGCVDRGGFDIAEGPKNMRFQEVRGAVLLFGEIQLGRRVEGWTYGSPSTPSAFEAPLRPRRGLCVHVQRV
jgi:hypothetical protein